MKVAVDASAVMVGAALLAAWWVYRKAANAVNEALPTYPNGDPVPLTPTIWNLPAVTRQAVNAMSDAWDKLVGGTQ